MWARVIELMLGVWLSLSPFIFRYPAEERFLWINDFVCAGLILVFALASYWPSLDKVHLLQLGVAGWLIGVAFVQPDSPPPPPYQNYVSLGLLLGMFAVIPSHASRPPRAWDSFARSR